MYKFLQSRYSTDDHLRSFRGKKPKKLDSVIARQVDANFTETNPDVAQSVDDTPVGLEEREVRGFNTVDVLGLTRTSSTIANQIRCG